PTSLPVAGIAGLDTINRFTLQQLHGHELKRLAAVARKERAHGAIAAAKAIGPQAGDENEFTAQELWGIYDDPGAASLTKANGTSSPTAVQKSSASLGQGQTLGIFGEGETSSVVDQLRLFEAAMGLPKVPVHVVHTEGGPDSAYGDNTGAIEWYLDSQSSTGMAPDLSDLDFYFAKTLFDADIFQDFNSWANDPNGPRQMNASFGECEANPTNPITGPLAQQPYGTELGDELQAMGDPILRQAAMEGRTLFASAGDTGSGCPELVAPIVGAGNGVVIQPVPFVGYPCDSQYAVCVGGTVVSSKGTTYPTAAQRSAETSWTYSGGGSSHFIPEPSYQQGVKNIDLPCVSTPTGGLYLPTSAPTCRGVPDIGDLSGNITGDGYFIYIDGEPSSEGGTSLSSPLMTGQWARVQAAASSSVQSAGGLGFANPVIYRQASGADACTSSPCSAPVYERDFFDVTDSEFGAGNGAYQPGPGWDYASGWGALNVANFTQDVDGRTSAAKAAGAGEKPAVDVTTASMTSPTGNATDPVDVSNGNQPSLDLTRATLTTSSNGATVIATLTGPSIGSTPPADAPNGNDFYVAWQYGGKVYYAKASQSQTGSFTYTSGNTGTYGTSSTYGYNDASSSAATGSLNSATHTITIKVPAKEVGSPTLGSVLTVPQAFDQLDASALAETTDSSDQFGAISVDGGRADSIGEEVVVGGAASGSASGSKTFGGGYPFGKDCNVGGPVVHAHARITAKQLYAHGSSNNRGCNGRVRKVAVSLARSIRGHSRCRFLTAKGTFARVTSCKPRDFVRARGTKRWTYRKLRRFPKGVYFVWAHATNTRGLTTRNTARKHIFFRLR
ncbi:MAG: S53 family peptidase, partial [Solirubrobacteraceae bacterium]